MSDMEYAISCPQFEQSKARKEVEALSAAAIGDLDKLPGNNEFLEQLIRLLVNRER